MKLPIFNHNFIKIFLGIVLFLVFVSTAKADENNYPVFRFWSDDHEVHFFTTNSTEKNILISDYPDNIWRYENIAFATAKTKQPGSSPVYRFWKKSNNAHFYTVSKAEKDLIISTYSEDIWKYEGVAFYVYTGPNAISDLKPVYRFWSAENQTHFYTNSLAEKNLVQSSYPENIWKYEGVAFYTKNFKQLNKPREVATSCPISTQSCVPCVEGDPYCRIESGQTSGFKGWACQNNNPGNIRYDSFRNDMITNNGGEAACGQRNGYMVFRDYDIGRNSLKVYIRAIANGEHPYSYDECGDCNLKQFFGYYAPASDQNNPNSYANNVANRIGVNADTTSLNWIVANKLDAFVAAIQVQEGWFTN